MATIVLSAAGAAIGSGFGGTILGLTGAVIGRAAGAVLGGVIDQKLFGQDAPLVETGRVESFRVQSAQEGTAIPRVMGRMRIGGQMIWSSRFKETVQTSTSGGGKGAPSPEVTTQSYTYSVSVAFALGEGVIDRVGRIWADGTEVPHADLNYTVYTGDETQLPDPVISAVEGIENTPAYRGTAYVVIEDLQLEQFGNRIPQLNFEVFRKAQPEGVAQEDAANMVQSVCLIPGTGEYALATTPVDYGFGFGAYESANVNTNRGQANVVHALDDLVSDLPNNTAANLVVTWFGTDLRCGLCKLRPQVEQKRYEGAPMAWDVSGINRAQAIEVSQDDEGRPVFGGTPADASVLEGIAALKERGQRVTFYPFILMDIQEGNGLIDPYRGEAEQASIPWRGRITTSLAPTIAGSPDGTAAVEAEVEAFFGHAAASDFTVNGQTIAYTGDAEWSYRRFILHYAHLCVLAGGVDAFCIGSELRGLTQIRGAAGRFPVVEALRDLAHDVRSILGPDVKIGYAADWSEYFGYQPQDGSGDVIFHLDPLWADENIDFVGIDNYVPLSDWRDEPGHVDAEAGSLYELDYLRSNIEGGEGYDWYYASAYDRDTQTRTPITDGAYGEDWIYRYKDFANWWKNPHHNRIDGVREGAATDWIPQSKPIWFTEFGCPAVDKGTNQPNVFLDEKSSESAVPYYSTGAPDNYIQSQYLTAMLTYWGDEAHNPTSTFYDGPMVDLANASVWAWDTRPWPDFPDRLSLWSDGVNFARGHWISGRFADQSLANVVSEICELSGVTDYDVSELQGTVVGFAIRDVETGRQSLQSLMLAYGFASFEEGGRLIFKTRTDIEPVALDEGDLAVLPDQDDVVAKVRTPDAERMGRLRVQFWDQNAHYEAAAVESRLTGDESLRTSSIQVPLVLDRGTGQNIADRMLSEARVARDEIKLALPPSRVDVALGDFISVGDSPFVYRVDRLEEFGARLLEASRVERHVFDAISVIDVGREPVPVVRSAVPYTAFMDLPLLTGAEVPHAPHFAATGDPWGSGVAVYSSNSDDGFQVNTTVDVKSVLGVSLSDLPRSNPARWDHGDGVLVQFSDDVQSLSERDVLDGGNAAAIRAGGGDWEVFQFQTAELQPDGSYRLKGLLRGQLGTEWVMPDVWPIGAQVVLLGAGIKQIELAVSVRGLERNYRVGPADRPVSDVAYQQQTLSFDGVGLRPYAPVHLRVVSEGGGYALRWIRRTRIDGDSWQSLEVPLGEDTERYHIRVVSGGDVVREGESTAPEWAYSPADVVADGVTGEITFEVAQISERFGIGPYNRMTINV